MTFKPLPAFFLAQRGFCCGSQCQQCPYIPRHTKGSSHIDDQWLACSSVHEDATYEEYLSIKKERT